MAQQTIFCSGCGERYSLSPQEAMGQFYCTKCGALIQPLGVAPLPGQMPPSHYQAGAGGPVPTSGFAIASLVCGACGCIPLAGLLALAFGIVGIVQTKDGRKKGLWMSITGMCLGVLMLPLMISILLPALNRAREQANRVKCASNMRLIGQAIQMYCNDNHGEYPPDLVALTPYSLSPDVFVCPSSKDSPAGTISDIDSGGHDSYIYLGKGLSIREANGAVPVLYESDDDHRDGANFLFADGSVQFIAKAQEPQVLSSVPGATPAP